MVERDNRGGPLASLYRDKTKTLELLAKHQQGRDPPHFVKDGLCAVYKPFWAELPHCDIFRCFTPDILHQLHKGVFKDHLVHWCTQVMGEKEIDKRFKAMNGYPGLRHFKKGISSVTQWTGTEHKEMEKILLGITIGGIPSRMILVVRSLLDFIYLSQLQYHTSTTISSLENCLKTFHNNKNIIVELEIREHLNIPKVHALLHYVDCIRTLGSPDGYNSESPERLHIDFVKEAYRASNKRDYVEQMAVWLQRHEAMWIRESFLIWVEKRLENMIKASDPNTLDDPAYDEEEVEPIDVTQRDINITHSQDNSDTRDRLNLRYSLAKSPPYQNLPVDKLTEKFGTTNFLPALSTFLRHNLPGTTITPSNCDCFDAYKQIVISLPSNRYLGDRTNVMDRVRTSPSVPASGRALPRHGHFDTAFVVEDLALYKSEGGLSGIYIFFSLIIYLNPFFFVFCRSSRRSDSINIRFTTPVRIISSSSRLYRMVHAPRIF